MTPLMLQDELVEEMKRLFADYLYKAPTGDCVSINVYPQNIPVNETDDDEDPIPYLLVRLNSGKDDGTRDSFNVVRVLFIAGVWDDSNESQGHRDLMNIFQKIYERFQTNPNLNGKAAYTGEFEWALQDDNYYPYSFGACTLSFNIAAIRREDPFA